MSEPPDDQPAAELADSPRSEVAGSETRTRLEVAPDTQRLLAGRYRLDALLGRGSMGAVWKAQDVVLGRAVAVKEVLLPPTQTDEENHVARQRALREARSIAALSHPNVVTLYDVVEDDGRPWVVMELVPAKSLAQIIKEDGTLAPTEAARIGVAVLAALESAHEVGIIHRDVKPGNILVPPDGRVKLADFGISRRADDSQLTRTGLMVGSPSYIAPEVARGREATSASDIWGLGATLQCAVEGAPPFDLGDPVATLTAVVGDPPRPAPHAGPLQPLLTRMLDKDPRTRIRTDELHGALQAIVDQHSAPRPSYSPPSGPLAQPMSGPMSGVISPAGAQGYQNRPAPQTYPGWPGAGPGQPGSGPAQAGQPGSGPAQPGQQGAGPGQRTAYIQGPHGPTYAAARTLAPATGQHTGLAAHQPATSYGRPATAHSPKKKRNAWIPAVIGILVAALIAGGIYWFLSEKDSGSGSADPSTTGTTSVGPSESGSQTTTPPEQNDSKIEGGTASGAIKVGEEFRPFAFTLPAGWEVGTFNDDRSEFLLSSGGEDPASMVKVTVVAGVLSAPSVDAQIKSEMGNEGSPAQLPAYQEITYEVRNGNVLWQYSNKLKGADRRGFYYAANRDGILWKIITAGPADQATETAAVANEIIASLQT
ncbi:serine/threonine-protein kinase [Blastococcus sp. Marseille-P5729]|uniref:serine/threonine-protein kinase n=1 Tax=Blastococcus sp. Marseille-P5729 TaxID=2086582 RepID=UPI000D0FEEE8|nr:serine/threonine-protein kinase [Blastococcus sp. Marseille-P5729]